ncbi:hypothetical protein ThvES_00021340, partial [Thiovulum sp. ES]
MNRESKQQFDSILKSGDEVFYFKNADFEEIENQEFFKKIKNAIKSRNLISFEHYFRGKDFFVENAKPIKILFNENNWYLLFISEEKMDFSRINFIKKLQVLKHT